MADLNGSIMYAVTAELPDEATRQAYLDWLTGGHIQEVVGSGAIDAEVIAIDSGADDNGPVIFRVESRYTFPTRGALDAYIRDHAPRLRAQGVALFGNRGVTYNRRIGPILAVFPNVSPGHGERV